MWTLTELRAKSIDENLTCINTDRGKKWVPARPENYKKSCMTLIERFKHAYAVFSCKAEAFTWPEGQ